MAIVKLEDNVLCDHVAGIAHTVKLSGRAEDDSMGSQALTEGFDFSFQDNDHHIVCVDVWIITGSRSQARSMAVKLVQIGRRPLKDQTRVKSAFDLWLCRCIEQSEVAECKR